MVVATKIELYGDNSAGDVMPFTVSSSVAIPKGTLMQLSASPRTIAASSTYGQVFVGVATAEKDSADTSTQLGVWTNGVFKMTASGSINDGDTVILSTAANTVEASNACTDRRLIVGTAFNDAASSLVVVRVLK